MKAKINYVNIKSYLVGNLRYEIFYSKFRWLLPTHIVEQIEMRIDYMEPRCKNNGSCELCGCSTTALQMANKACDKPCYPTMLSRVYWKKLKKGHLVYDRDLDLFWTLRPEGLIHFKDAKECGEKLK